MGVKKKTRKFATMKRTISGASNINEALTDRKKNVVKAQIDLDKKKKQDPGVKEIPQVASSLFFQHNTALRPPYSVLVDTNFINHSIQSKLELITAMMDCLYAKCTPVISDCVIAELEKMGSKYRIALRIAKDPRFERIQCDHKGSYVDDCIVNRVMAHKCYLVATDDRDLKRRLRKIPGVPIMTCGRGKFSIERLPDAPER